MARPAISHRIPMIPRISIRIIKSISEFLKKRKSQEDANPMK